MYLSKRRTELPVLAWFVFVLFALGYLVARVHGLNIVTDPLDSPTHLAIAGEGHFLVRDPMSGRIYAKKRGDFTLDVDGWVITPEGQRVQMSRSSDPGSMVDLRLDPFAYPQMLRSFSVASNGVVWAIFADGSQAETGKILLQRFLAPERLKRVGSLLYEITPESQPQPRGFPGEQGLGVLVQRALDMTPEVPRLELQPSAAKAGAQAKGPLTVTCVQTDFGIVGNGFFLVRDTNTSEMFATRCGAFVKDAENYFTTYDGLRLQGVTNETSGATGDLRFDLSLSPFLSPDRPACRFFLGSDGALMAITADGGFCWSGRCQLFAFAHPELLVATNGGRFGNVNAAQPSALSLAGGFCEPGVRQGCLELVNLPADLLAQRKTLNLEQQHALQWTNQPACLALSGPGYFALRHPTTGALSVCRNGAFTLDANGYLVTASGLRVQGYCDPALSAIGDIKIDTTGKPAWANTNAGIVGFYFFFDGKVDVILNDGNEFIRGQILLQYFDAPHRLKANADGIFTNLADASPWPELIAPGMSKLGCLQGSAIELSEQEELTLPSREAVRVRIAGEPGQVSVIEASPDLRRWKPLGTVTNTTEDVEFADVYAATERQRFYRVRQAPLP